jgi:predicted PurR-regulated permease PerM
MEPAKLAPAAKPRTADVLGLQVGVVAIVGLYFGREVLIPITLAILLSFLLAPVVSLFRQLLPRVVAVLLAVLLALGVVLGLGGLIGMQVASLAPNVPQYANVVEKKFETARNYAVDHLSSVMSRLQDSGGTTEAAAPKTDRPAGTNKEPLAVQIVQSSPTPLQMAERVLDPLASPLSTAVIVFIFAIFILLQREDLRDRLIRLVGSGDLHRTTVALDDAGRRLSKYFLAQAGVNLVFGCIIGLGLWIIGLPSPVLWGVLGAMLRFVPYVGPVLASGLPIALAAGVSPGWELVGWTAGLFAVVEGITGQVVEPLLYGHSTGLSPFAVVVAATFWTWLWGPIGLILSTPLTLCLVVLGRHVKRLEFLDVMLGDRPALTPVESFYQRMLAGDPDEAQEQAETLLKDQSLSSYYDDVALKGLQLAASDLERGVLTEKQIERVKEAITQLAEDLDKHPDVDQTPKPVDADGILPPSPAEQPAETPRPVPGQAPAGSDLPPPWQMPTAVMCLAGRGPLDEAASTLLAQLLRKHGLGAKVVGYEDASRGRITSLDVKDVAMVCVSYLDISGSPSHLRYLMKRLHGRLPGKPILVGLWPAEDAVLSDEAMRRAIGADYYSKSLHEALQSCLAEARQKVDEREAA